MGPGSPASTRCHWCSSQNKRTQHQARWEKKKSASLVGEFCKIPGIFLFKSTNKPVSTSLKHFPFFSPLLCKEEVPLNFSYLQSLLLSAYITCVLLTSLTLCYFFFSVVWNGTVRKRKSSRWAVPLFLSPAVSIQPKILLTPEYSLDGRAGKQHSRRHISRQGCHSHPEPLLGRTSHSGGRL